MLASALLVLSLTAAAYARDHGATAAELRALYGKYNESLLGKRGEEAAALLHPSVVRIYADALTLARRADAKQLRTAPLHQRLIALYLRWHAPPEIVRSENPREVVAFMVREGVLRSDVGVSTDLQDFVIAGDEAHAFLYAQGRKTPLRIRFAPIDGEWKVDVTHLQTMADDIYRQMAVRQNISEDQALLNLIAAYTRRPITDAIWQPLDRRGTNR